MKEILNIKKLLLLLITLITFTNVGYASFPVLGETIISIDTIIPDTNKVVKKETTEEYHIRMQKQGFDIESCVCESCRNGISPLTNNVEVKKVLKKNTKKIRNRTLIIVAIILLILIRILVGIWIDNYDGFKGNGLG